MRATSKQKTVRSQSLMICLMPPSLAAQVLENLAWGGLASTWVFVGSALAWDRVMSHRCSLGSNFPTPSMCAPLLPEKGLYFPYLVPLLHKLWTLRTITFYSINLDSDGSLECWRLSVFLNISKAADFFSFFFFFAKMSLQWMEIYLGMWNLNAPLLKLTNGKTGEAFIAQHCHLVTKSRHNALVSVLALVLVVLLFFSVFHPILCIQISYSLLQG